MKTIPFIALLLLAISPTFAQQTSSFSRYLIAGIEAYERLDFQKAQNQFKAAIISEGINQDEKQEALDWLSKANNGYILKIEEKQDSLNRALKNLAQEKKRAISFAMQSEANRLALLSENELKNNNARSALYLAYQALATAKADQTPEHVLAFGYAVSNALAQNMDKQSSPYESLTLLKDQNKVITQSADNTIRILDLKDGKTRTIDLKKKNILFAKIAPNASWLLTATDDHVVTIWNENAKSVAQLKGHTEAISYATYSPDYELVLTCSRDNTAKLWKMDGTLLTTFNQHSGNLYYGEFSADGNNILTRASDGFVYIWDRNGQTLGTIRVENSYMNSAIFSPEDDNILTASSDGVARIWSKDGTLLKPLKGQAATIKNAFYAPNDPMIVTNGLDHQLRLWTPKGAAISTLKGHKNTINVIQFSPDHKTILTASNDRTSILWDKQGNRLQQFSGHQKAVLQASFSPSGNYILSTSKDGFAKLWTITGQLLMNIDLQSNDPIPAVFSADEKHIFAIINNRLARLPLPDTALAMIENQNFFSSKERTKFDAAFDIQDFDLQ
ncbi:MAG: hypothetical protein AAF847_10430 [Bacteroidota bacterium]